MKKFILALSLLLLASFGCAYTDVGFDGAIGHMRAANMARAAKEKASLWNRWICEPNGGKLNCLEATFEDVELFDPSIEDIYKIDFEEWHPIKPHGLFYSKFDMNGYNTISIWWDGDVLINGESEGLGRGDVAAITHLYAYIVYRKFEDI